MSEKIAYTAPEGFWDNDNPHTEVVVTYSDGTTKPLDPRLDIVNHSPTGYAWGYLGSGPAQLAFAILADATNPRTAKLLYHHYKREVIANLSQKEGFCLTLEAVNDWIEGYCAAEEQGGAHFDRYIAGDR